MFDISGTKCGIYWLNIFACGRVDCLDSFIDCYGLAAGDIYDFTCGLFSFCCEQVCIDDIINISKIAALEAVAENGGRPAFQYSCNERRYGGGILAGRVLMGAKNVKITQ